MCYFSRLRNGFAKINHQKSGLQEHVVKVLSRDVLIKRYSQKLTVKILKITKSFSSTLTNIELTWWAKCILWIPRGVKNTTFVRGCFRYARPKVLVWFTELTVSCVSRSERHAGRETYWQRMNFGKALCRSCLEQALCLYPKQLALFLWPVVHQILICFGQIMDHILFCLLGTDSGKPAKYFKMMRLQKSTYYLKFKNVLKD